MGNLSRKILFLNIYLFILTSCGQGLKQFIQDPKLIASTVELEGKIKGLDGEIDLTSLKNKPLILVFAEDTCLACYEEVMEFKDHLKDPKNPPKNVEILTILNGAIEEDALYFSETHEIPWKVAYDETAGLFKKYCLENTVPCTLVYMPGEGVIFNKHGKVPVATLEDLTGVWED